MPGVRLHPNYHGYSLDDARFVRLLEQATAARLFVQIAAGMEDVRTQHPLLRVPEVDLAPLVKILPGIPGVRVQILNVWPTGPRLEKLAEVPGLYFDTARAEGTDGVPNLVRRVPAGRVLFGTHAPFLIPEAALIRVHESGQLEEAELRSVLSGNADSFLAGPVLCHD
jgi:predicted TIM-barrel fold metal-dependent hydrolase